MTEQQLKKSKEAAAEERVPDYAEVGFDEAFANLLRRRGQLAEARAKVQALIDANTSDISTALQFKGIRSVQVDQRWQATWCKGKQGSAKIDGARLLDLGVTSDVIKKATVTAPDGKPYLLVTDLQKARRGTLDE